MYKFIFLFAVRSTQETLSNWWLMMITANWRKISSSCSSLVSHPYHYTDTCQGNRTIPISLAGHSAPGLCQVIVLLLHIGVPVQLFEHTAFSFNNLLRFLVCSVSLLCLLKKVRNISWCHANHPWDYIFYSKKLTLHSWCMDPAELHKGFTSRSKFSVSMIL